VLLETKGIDVNKQDIDGYTALHHAAKRSHAEIMRALLDVRGINVNARCYRMGVSFWIFNTALQWAVEDRDFDVIKMLLMVPGIDLGWRNVFLCIF